jgi:D-alanyl-D-alanine carboxypeptidase (penicillin-binding protein 5/6)
MKQDIQKFIFLAVIIGLAALHVKGQFGAGQAEGVSAEAALVSGLKEFIPALSSESAVSASVDSPAPSEENVYGVVAPPQDLAFVRVQNTPPPSVSASEALVGDLRSGTIYYSTSSNSRWPLASLTKLMSATFISEKMSPTSTITLTSDDLVDGDYPGIFAALQTYTEGDLFNAMLVGSVNEAAKALARTLGGDSFVADMNKRAADWGLTQTHFKDPDGISAANQSSAADVFKLASMIYENYPQIFKITRNSKITITELNSKTKKNIMSTHTYAGRKDFLGGKTGTTPEAGENLVTIISYSKREVVVVVMGADNRFKDTDQLLQWFKTDFNTSY